jgi:hypothetical protein
MYACVGNAAQVTAEETDREGVGGLGLVVHLDGDPDAHLSSALLFRRRVPIVRVQHLDASVKILGWKRDCSVLQMHKGGEEIGGCSDGRGA